jgi:hypothetical protein
LFTDWSDPGLDTRPVREHLAALDPEPDRDRKTPKVISLSDPCSAWTAKANKRVLFGYGLNYLIDNGHAVIVDVEATPARSYDEVAATRTMIERTDKRFRLKPKAPANLRESRFSGTTARRRYRRRLLREDVRRVASRAGALPQGHRAASECRPVLSRRRRAPYRTGAERPTAFREAGCARKTAASQFPGFEVLLAGRGIDRDPAPTI